MRVLVTGAAGFVGLNVLEVLASAGDEVLGLYRRRPESSSGWHRDDVRFEFCDVRNREALAGWITTWKPTHVVHAAAITPTSFVEREQPRAVLETNQLSTLTVLEAAARSGVSRVVFISSAGVYAPLVAATPIPEAAPLRHDGSLYGLTKIAGEGLCRWARRHTGPDARSVRVGPVYGPFERPTESRENMSLIWRAVQLMINGETVRCNNPTAEYDWIHGRDTARGIRLLLTTGQLHDDVYNLAGPAVTMQALLNTLSELVPGTTVDWSCNDDANLKVPDTYRRAPLDVRALTRDTGYSPRFGLVDGLRNYVGWVRGHSYWKGSER